MKLLNPMPPHNLFGLEDVSYDTAKVVVLPVPYDSTATYRVGSKEGPSAIIEASRNMELYNLELKGDVSKIGIFTTDPLAPEFDGPGKMVDSIAKQVQLFIEDGKVPVVLGGEHTVAVGAIKAFAKMKKDFTVLHFDAHSDMRDEYMGSRYCHACVMCRIRELVKDYWSVGVRSIEGNDLELKNDHVIYMSDIHSMGIEKLAETLIKNTKKDIYITFDSDCMDPSEMPSTGTPEPDGMKYHDLMKLFGILLRKKNLIGFDFNEFTPIPGLWAPDFLAAKFIYNVLGYAFYRK
jgi:agmatinase